MIGYVGDPFTQCIHEEPRKFTTRSDEELSFEKKLIQFIASQVIQFKISNQLIHASHRRVAQMQFVAFKIIEQFVRVSPIILVDRRIVDQNVLSIPIVQRHRLVFATNVKIRASACVA